MVYNYFKKTNVSILIILISGALILAFGINLFLVPHDLAFGGVTGITIILQSTTKLPVYVSNFVISLAIILIGFTELGQDFLMRTLIPTSLLPLFLLLTKPLSRLEISLPVSAFAGSVTMGIGIALTIFAGGSTAGPDTIGLILQKHFSIPITVTMVVIDLSVILCGFHIYGIETASWSMVVAILMNVTVKLAHSIFKIKFKT